VASTRHRRAWDFTGISELQYRKALQVALTACDYPFIRIRQRTGRRVPVTVSDLSRYNARLGVKSAHVHVHDEYGEAHLLGHPQRRAALGLYWLPTPEHPAGRVEVDRGAMRDGPLAREVFLAEAAHAVDYGVMTDEERRQIGALFEHVHQGHDHAGWFEEQGESDYWSWRGERWMGLFMAAFAPSLPRPLEARQPWHWSYDASDIEQVRRILL